eukprot:2417351-Rhodomonas_salina.2
MVSGTVCLRACYAMSGTDMVQGSICLRACYAMSSTDKAYQSQAEATTAGPKDGRTLGGEAARAQRLEGGSMPLWPYPPPYATSGTNTAYAASSYARAMRCPRMPYRLLVFAMQRPVLNATPLSGTDIAYARSGTPCAGLQVSVYAI